MERPIGPRLAPVVSIALGLALAACNGSRHDPKAGLSIAGSVDVTGASGEALAVDPALRVLYIGGGFGQTGIVRVDVSNPAAMTATPFALGFGGGVAVDLATHRVGATDGYTGDIGIFEATGVTFDAAPIVGCGGSVAAGDATFLASTQCVDRLSVYDDVLRRVVYDVPLGGVGSHVFFNPATARFYGNRTPKSANAGRDNALVLTPVGATFTASDMPLDGDLAVVDPALNRLWFYAVPTTGTASPLVALDGSSHSPLFTTPVTTTSGALAISGGLLVQSGSDKHLRLFDAATGVELDDIDFIAASGGYEVPAGIAADADHAYVIGQKAGAPKRLFVLALRRP